MGREEAGGEEWGEEAGGKEVRRGGRREKVGRGGSTAFIFQCNFQIFRGNQTERKVHLKWWAVGQLKGVCVTL